MKPLIRTLRIVNPHHKRKASRRKVRRARKSRRNPGELILLTNPRRGGDFKMKHHSKKRRSSRRRKSNPSVKSHRRSSSRRYFARGRRRNPSVGGYSLGNLAKLGVGAAVGAVGTRALTQSVLADKNVDWTGYVANLVAALGLGWAGAKFIGKEVGIAVATGGIAGTVLRIYTEKVSKTSPNLLSGLGDLEFSSGMGAYIDTGYAIPSVSQAGGGGYVVAPSAAALPSGIASGASASPVVAADRFRSRFAVQ